jgi:2-keto-4-pentenoate hydratase/2-oxohepta-3-ene-1,7-dioic acid hydratase in catechol pathway
MEIILDSETYHANRIFCIGRNYIKHIEELNNEIPSSPVVFLKPASCLAKRDEKIPFPSHGAELHYEAEIVVLLGREGKPTDSEEAKTFIAGVSIGLDLTLRDVQSNLKHKGLPWEKAKAFEKSAPIGNFLDYTSSFDLENIEFSCYVNNSLKQKGNSKNMIFSIPNLIIELAKIWYLRAGDLIFTGTPSGVGPLIKKDTITISNSHIGTFSWEIE